MTMAGPSAALSLAAAFAAATVGTHALEWHLTERANASGRVASFDLAARTHVIASLSLVMMAALDLPGSGWAVAFLWVGSVLFCGALYLHGLTGAVWAMPATMPGAVALSAAWIVVTIAWFRGA